MSIDTDVIPDNEHSARVRYHHPLRLCTAVAPAVQQSDCGVLDAGIVPKAAYTGQERRHLEHKHQHPGTIAQKRPTADGGPRSWRHASGLLLQL